MYLLLPCSIYLWMQLVKMSTLIIISTNLLVGKAPSQHLPYLTTFHLSEFSSPPFPHGHKKMGWHIRKVTFVFLEDAPFKGDPERYSKPFAMNQELLGLWDNVRLQIKWTWGWRNRFLHQKTKKRNMRKGSQLFLERSHVLMFSWHFGRVVSRKKPMASTWWEVVESSKISKHLCGFGAICTLRFLFVCASSDLI